MWVRLAAMNFTDAAARWLQSVKKQTRSCSWSKFTEMILDRFGRDQHELLIRQLLYIKQSGLVLDYIDRFSAIVDQLAAYESNTDLLFIIP